MNKPAGGSEVELSPQAKAILDRVNEVTTLGGLRTIAAEIKTDHALALQLWSTTGLEARRLAILVMDKKRMSQEFIDTLEQDVQLHDPDERIQLFDWLMANQLSKSSGGRKLIESWESSTAPLQRRLFWYHQARLRWTGQTPPPNTEHLLDAIEGRLADEVPEVQWAMNFTAGQIGTYQEEYRERCIAIGERVGLYREEPFSPGCTPNYLPEFIRIQAAKIPG